MPAVLATNNRRAVAEWFCVSGMTVRRYLRQHQERGGDLSPRPVPARKTPAGSTPIVAMPCTLINGSEKRYRDRPLISPVEVEEVRGGHRNIAEITEMLRQHATVTTLQDMPSPSPVFNAFIFPKQG